VIGINGHLGATSCAGYRVTRICDKHGATAAQASMGDAAACTARADTEVRTILGRVLAQRRSVETAFGVGDRAVAVNAGELLGAGGGRAWGWGLVQALLRSYVRTGKPLRAELAGLAAAWLSAATAI
jgi:hypothetical protein